VAHLRREGSGGRTAVEDLPGAGLFDEAGQPEEGAFPLPFGPITPTMAPAGISSRSMLSTGFPR
jgi:hypothetical protein